MLPDPIGPQIRSNSLRSLARLFHDGRSRHVSRLVAARTSHNLDTLGPHRREVMSLRTASYWRVGRSGNCPYSRVSSCRIGVSPRSSSQNVHAIREVMERILESRKIETVACHLSRGQREWREGEDEVGGYQINQSIRGDEDVDRNCLIQ